MPTTQSQRAAISAAVLSDSSAEEAGFGETGEPREPWAAAEKVQ
jgi:hypothetical protein